MSWFVLVLATVFGDLVVFCGTIIDSDTLFNEFTTPWWEGSARFTFVGEKKSDDDTSVTEEKKK